VNKHIHQGSGDFLRDRMPGYRLPSLSAATPLNFAAGCIQPTVSQEPTACFAYLDGISQLSYKSNALIILS
jgi:hypothetical protein